MCVCVCVCHAIGAFDEDRAGIEVVEALER